MPRQRSNPAEHGPQLRIDDLAQLEREFELLRSNNFGNREQACRAVAAWLDEYNTVRRHSTELMLSPIDFERRDALARTTAAAA